MVTVVPDFGTPIGNAILKAIPGPVLIATLSQELALGLQFPLLARRYEASV